MMRSMYASVSGLCAQQTKMDVIGNNIANVNTIGYRGSRVTFQEVFSQTIKGAGAPDEASGTGGTNPIQIGLGMTVGAVDIVTTRGSLQRTDNPTDMSIEGEGFFIVKGSKNGTYMFTRAGNFSVDKLGNLVTPAGMNVYGWQDYGRKANTDGTYTFDTEKPIEPLNLFVDPYNKNKRMIAAKATSEAVFVGNLDAAKTAITPAGVTSPMAIPPQFMTPITVYDSLGNDYKINLNFWKVETTGGSGTPANTTWYWEVDDGADFTNATVSGRIKFNDDGEIVDEAGFSVNPAIVLRPAVSIGSKDIEMKLDMSKLTMYAADNSVKPTTVDGYPTGNLVTFNVGSDGLITGVYSNGQQQPLGMMSFASFDNPAGLQRAGDNTFIPTTNSGEFKRALKAGAEGVGKINPGTLEMSNIDLSKEFTEMIVTQRGFQANSRIMTVVDEMLQEMANMKR